MKFSNKLFCAFSLLAFTYTTVNAQSDVKSSKKNAESIVVTFECEPCTKRNKFRISGLENHVFIQAEFPIKQELKPGEYDMTYWQNKVQQIHLPFTVSPKSENVIIVKD